MSQDLSSWRRKDAKTSTFGTKDLAGWHLKWFIYSWNSLRTTLRSSIVGFRGNSGKKRCMLFSQNDAIFSSGKVIVEFVKVVKKW